MLPSRFDIAFNSVLIVLCSVSAVGCAVRGEWWWVLASVGAVVFFGWELLGDLAVRRYYRRAGGSS